MGKLNYSLNSFLVEEIKNSIDANNGQYYSFAANPIEWDSGKEEVSNTTYDRYTNSNWKLLFGKKVSKNDIAVVIEKKMWANNTAYDRYDNTQDLSNNNFYVITEPEYECGVFHIYKCIDNANGSNSTINPSTISNPSTPETFETADGYKWRYITSTSGLNFDRFSSNNYFPITTNNSLSVSSPSYAGIDVYMIANSGNGYSAYHSGNIVSYQNTTLLQIASGASEFNNYYTNNSIYIYNTGSTGQLVGIFSYTSNSSGKFVRTETAVNTSLITNNSTQYIISPRVIVYSDANTKPLAYTTINSTSNSIHSIVVVEPGTNISWANVVIQSNSTHGSGANVYAIVPPPGGHGHDPKSELNAKGIAFNIKYSNTQSGNIATSNIVYTRIGLLKDPYAATANATTGQFDKSTTKYSNAYFEQYTKATVSPNYTFTKGSIITGNTSNAQAIVAFSNSSQVYLVGDNDFISGETIKNSNSAITITETADIYSKDLIPFYVENINTVNRIDGQTEEFKLTIVTD